MISTLLGVESGDREGLTEEVTQVETRNLSQFTREAKIVFKNTEHLKKIKKQKNPRTSEKDVMI